MVWEHKIVNLECDRALQERKHGQIHGNIPHIKPTVLERKRLSGLTISTNPKTKWQKNSDHTFGSTDHKAKNFPKAKKKIYSMDQVPEEEDQEEDSEYDSMGDVIRENSDYDQTPIEEFLVEYHEETKLETGLLQETAN
ncbi:hypothetical protein O181_021718 [Austropuccinia psidii MF-1]|uniref:Uncharacterized protein n=1 Tax=Austropuccinia psidii MF-1 TaxID=1389203 RepID=A0A9Q3GVN8_9BASI|nr:hypothetical protein [Austropuccinia psidii MF-1]